MRLDSPVVMLGIAALAVVAAGLFFMGSSTNGASDLFCQPPASLVETSGFDMALDLSARDASGGLVAKLGERLEAEFAAHETGEWSRVAGTYQCQVCQLLKAQDCDDLPASECLASKRSMLDASFDKIQAVLNAQRTDQIEACVAERIAEYQAPRTGGTEGKARAPGPGWAGGKKTASEEICYAVGPGQEIVRAETTERSCHDGRCSVTAPSISSDRREVCITAKAWSASKSFGGGGSGGYRMTVTYRSIASSERIEQFRSTCKGVVDTWITARGLRRFGPTMW